MSASESPLADGFSRGNCAMRSSKCWRWINLRLHDCRYEDKEHRDELLTRLELVGSGKSLATSEQIPHKNRVPPRFQIPFPDLVLCLLWDHGRDHAQSRPWIHHRKIWNGYVCINLFPPINSIRQWHTSVQRLPILPNQSPSSGCPIYWCQSKVWQLSVKFRVELQIRSWKLSFRYDKPIVSHHIFAEF